MLCAGLKFQCMRGGVIGYFICGRPVPVSQYLVKTFEACHRCPELSISGSTLTSYLCSQVHRAVMQLKGKPREVVVKVRHPGVAHSITVDFRLLKPVAAAASRIPSLKGLSLKESLAQFSANMTAQARTCLLRCHTPRKESWSGDGGAHRLFVHVVIDTAVQLRDSHHQQGPSSLFCTG